MSRGVGMSRGYSPLRHGTWDRGGYSHPGGCLLRGMSAPGGCLLRGVSAPGRGCLLPGGVSALGGGVCVCSWGVSASGGVVSQHALRQTPPPLRVDRYTPVKT